jgi:sulfur-carrier protein
MAVEVRIPTVLRSQAGGQATVDASGETIGEVISTLAVDFPGLAGQIVSPSGELHRFVNIYLNDDDVRFLEKLDTKVSSGDVVTILPAVAGGSN